MRLKFQSHNFRARILVLLLVSANLRAQKHDGPTRPQPAAETHQFDGLLGNWKFVEDLNLNSPKAPPTVLLTFKMFSVCKDFFMASMRPRLLVELSQAWVGQRWGVGGGGRE